MNDPELRATLDDFGLSIIRWWPGLIVPGGPNGTQVRPQTTAVVVCDLRIVRATDDGITVASDLIVTEVSGSLDESPRRAIVDWAASLDYRRVWFSRDVVELEPRAQVGGTWQVDCPCCLSRWSDDTVPFWLTARQTGSFPLWCLLCGHPVRQPLTIGEVEPRLWEGLDSAPADLETEGAAR